MDIQTYKEFVTLVTHRSFVSAARDLNMSQPTLSRHMAALSKELRHDLFYDSRPLTLTPAGEAVLETASLIIREQDNLVESLKRISSLGGGRIRVLSLRADALYVGIHDAFSAMQAKHPNYRVDYIALDDSGLDPFQMIERDKVDVSFLACITAEEWPGCETPNHLKTIAIPEFHGELAVGIPKENELSKRDGISLKDLSEQVFIMQTNRCNERFQNDFVDCCLEEGFRPKIQPVPLDDAYSFYTRKPEGLHLLLKVDRQWRPPYSEAIKKHSRIFTLQDKKRFVNCFAIMKKESPSEAIAHFSQFLEEHTGAFMRDNAMQNSSNMPKE